MPADHALTRSPRITTIGVYGWTLGTFLDELRASNVHLLLDVRQRRGVRGPQYAWANSLRLQAALREAGIGYEHHPELAPTTELRHLQYAEDARRGEGKRSRTELASEYRDRYTREIVDNVDLRPLVERLERIDSNATAALFCVEHDARACHRSLIATRLHDQFGVETV